MGLLQSVPKLVCSSSPSLHRNKDLTESLIHFRDFVETSPESEVVAIEILWQPLEDSKNHIHIHDSIEFSNKIDWESYDALSPSSSSRLKKRLPRPARPINSPTGMANWKFCHMKTVLTIKQRDSNFNWYACIDYKANGIEVQTATTLYELHRRIDTHGDKANCRIYSADISAQVTPLPLRGLMDFLSDRHRGIKFNFMSNNCQGFTSSLWAFVTGNSPHLQQALRTRWDDPLQGGSLGSTGQPAVMFRGIPELAHLKVLNKADNIFISTASAGASETIWLRQCFNGWYWTPYSDPKGWVSVAQEAVPCGPHSGKPLSEGSLTVIRYLREHNPQGYPQPLTTPRECAVCFEVTRDVCRFEPCLHEDICWACSHDLFTTRISTGLCPFCRRGIDLVVNMGTGDEICAENFTSGPGALSRPGRAPDPMELDLFLAQGPG